jgi:hypothetical protein
MGVDQELCIQRRKIILKDPAHGNDLRGFKCYAAAEE